jgi:two-component system sensor histidine kinase HydH
MITQLNPSETVLYDSYYNRLRVRIDNLFSLLLIFQWVMAFLITFMNSPLTWSGSESSIHPHVWMALGLGSLLTVFPFIHLKRNPGDGINMYIICLSQMFYSILFIHLTGGRIETHFHIFGSLAFLAFYKNIKVIILATIITSIDHLGRGFFFPLSIYGVIDASVWRALEHAAWVIFEDIFLFIAIREGLENMRSTAVRENVLSDSLMAIEKKVQERTNELVEAQRIVSEQQQKMVNSSRLSSLGEMAAGIAHEINNPLAIIASTSKYLKKMNDAGKLNEALVRDSLNDVDQTVLRISKIIVGLRNISRDSSEEKFSRIYIKDIFSDLFSICTEKFRNHSIELSIIDPQNLMESKIYCRRIQISQVLLNIVSNAFDAVQVTSGQKWVRISLQDVSGHFFIRIADSGPGISADLREKIFQPFFTTKEIGKGTGLGLSLSKAIIDGHGGVLTLDPVDHTQFSISILHEKAEA